MPVMEELQLVLDHKFDPKTCRHTMNGEPFVLHCHHYLTLYTQLAEDCGMLDGRKLLTEVAHDTFYETLSSYYKQHAIEDVSDRIAIGEQYYAAMGLGQMHVKCAGPDGGEVVLEHSHLDEGWIKKFGKRTTPGDYVTAGYLGGLFSAVFNLSPRAFTANEVESIACGAPVSRFEVVAR
jgi:hypothetical protein